MPKWDGTQAIATGPLGPPDGGGWREMPVEAFQPVIGWFLRSPDGREAIFVSFLPSNATGGEEPAVRGIGCHDSCGATPAG